ncbi:MAG: transcription antitermination factor NusB [Actinomycetia bacterium]|nr:transcription antitermination factor NusB [Actinomycetes bacterium]
MSRRQAREVAVRWLYEHDVGGTDPEAILARGDVKLDAPSFAFARSLLEGVVRHRAELDAELERLSHDWRVERMSAVDRNILRLGLYELRFEPDVPAPVALSEAVQLANLYSTPEGKRFVNGILSAAARELGREG